MPNDQTGIPYEGRSDLIVDDWSAAVFQALGNWPIASGGKWTRWEPGYLVLEIVRHHDRAIDRIVLDTADDELTVSFGMWECHLEGPDWPDVKKSVEEAKVLIGDWLHGRMQTAVYFSGAGAWCGTISVDPNALIKELARGLEWSKDGTPARIEVRAPERERWRLFSILADGSIEEAS